MNNSQTVVLQLTSAVAIAGRILRAGDLVEVTKLEGADLVQRGRAVVVASDDAEDFADDAAPPEPADADLTAQVADSHPEIAAEIEAGGGVDAAATLAEAAKEAADDAAPAAAVKPKRGK